MTTTIQIDSMVVIPKTIKESPTREQMALQIICIENHEEDAEYFYDVDGYTIYAKAESGLWKITSQEFKFLAQSKN